VSRWQATLCDPIMASRPVALRSVNKDTPLIFNLLTFVNDHNDL